MSSVVDVVVVITAVVVLLCEAARKEHVPFAPVSVDAGRRGGRRLSLPCSAQEGPRTRGMNHRCKSWRSALAEMDVILDAEDDNPTMCR